VTVEPDQHLEFPQPLDSTRIPRYSEIATFMRAPRSSQLEDVEIGLIGVPFQLGTSVRMGSWAGPSAVREASRIVRGHNLSSGVSPFELASVADVGDSPHNPLDAAESLSMIQEHFSMLRDRSVRPIACGGDHTITLPILRGLSNGSPYGVLHLDAHTDAWEELYGRRENSGTVIRRAIEEGVIDPAGVIQMGIRGTRFGPGDVEAAEALGIRCITYDQYEKLGRDAVISEIHDVLDGRSVYITFDMDVLDPAYAPGTPGPELGGLSTRDAQVILRSLGGCNIVGADVAEVAPLLDPTGMTPIVAAHIMFELLCLVALAVANERNLADALPATPA
jgi:guanidinopropionase